MTGQNKSKNLGIIIFVILVVALAVPLIFFNLENARAQSAEMPLMAGRLEGSGTFFKLDESEYLKISLESSEPIKLSLESVSEIVILQLEPVLDSPSSTITLGGFLPNTTYHKYEDSYHNHLVFTTDNEGKYTYTQDLFQPHFIFIQPRPSTKFIKDDATGGDCYLIGNWDFPAKTCTLTQDLVETIQIDSDGITLDGNGHTITGYNTGFGVNISDGRINSIIKNLNIKNFTVGISVTYSKNNVITNNNLSNNYYGVYFMSSESNIINDNPILNNQIGISLQSSRLNTLRNNDISNNSSIGVVLYSSSSNTAVNNTILNNLNGLVIYTAVFNKIYNNNFVDNAIQSYAYRGDYNYFSIPPPDGGNYWSDFDTPEEGCYDLDNNNFYDAPRLIPNMGGMGSLRDNFPWTKKAGWLGPQNQEPQVSGLGQFKSDEITEILEGSITTENAVVFKATLSDPDEDQVKLQVEVKEFEQVFDENNLLESDFVDSGSEIVLTKNDFSDEQYKWRARAVDDQGGLSDWQEFGEIGNVDFEVKTVPLYTQVISPYPSEDLTDSWDHLPYAQGLKYGCGSTIRQCGCAITSVVMVARYYDIVETQGADVNPGKINEWLKNEPGGYQNGSVNWLAAAKYTNWRIQYEKTDKTTNNYALLDEYLNKNQPVISKEARGRGGLPHDHFIVIDNKLATTYGVKDPAWYNTKILDEQESNNGNKIRDYENGFDGLRIYKKGNGLAQAGMVFTLGSPAELLITDSQGRKVGKDQNGIEYNEIPEAFYFEENYDDPTGEEPPSEDKNKSLYILEPLEGEYKLEIIGTGDGQYSLYLSFYDTQGHPLAKEFHSEITSGQVVQYNIFFDHLNVNNSYVELFDETSPEAEIYFDEINQQLVIKGVDNATVNPVVSCLKSDKETICQIQDEAGNITKLIFDKLKREGKEIKAELKSIQYNNQPPIEFPKTELKYEWSLNRDGTIKELEQRIKVKDLFDVRAKYNHQKNETEIKIKLQNQREQEQTLPGTVIIKLITRSGILDFNF